MLVERQILINLDFWNDTNLVGCLHFLQVNVKYLAQAPWLILSLSPTEDARSVDGRQDDKLINQNVNKASLHKTLKSRFADFAIVAGHSSQRRLKQWSEGFNAYLSCLDGELRHWTFLLTTLRIDRIVSITRNSEELFLRHNNTTCNLQSFPSPEFSLFSRARLGIRCQLFSRC